ncbi:ribonuclease P protein subunit p25-like protein isoform X2 [Tribolium madens]|uniref:ribonuclease P protein subunit p25-like protein isoform X2 n=1 Tax=Tribolium madens TaxID=41895 RepID=UPI001CF7424B|nr:ribonuclease P protein subunit p25-like protein isoform X2 [Tribolium madens]
MDAGKRSAKAVVWTGFGQSVGKTVTCAEIMKREHNIQLHQITKLCYRIVEEFWDPVIPDLDQIVVKRKLPMIHILLSLETLSFEESGYQAPGSIIPFTGNSGSRKDSNRKFQKISRHKKSQ